MDNVQMGAFIAERRRQRGMTQRDIAACLNVTDKAVSKWERGQSSPDIALLQPLAALLEVTVDELLSGQAAETEVWAETWTEAPLAPPPELRTSRWRRVLSMLFTLALLTAEAVCVICDLAMSGRITWSVIPVSSIMLAWLVLTPLLLRGRYGAAPALAALTASIGPFLFIVAAWTVWQVFTVGIWIAAVAMGYLWGLYGICHWGQRPLRAVALALVLTMLAWLLLRGILLLLLRLPFLTVGEAMCLVQLAASGAALVVLDWRRG